MRRVVVGAVLPATVAAVVRHGVWDADQDQALAAAITSREHVDAAAATAVDIAFAALALPATDGRDAAARRDLRTVLSEYDAIMYSPAYDATHPDRAERARAIGNVAALLENWVVRVEDSTARPRDAQKGGQS